MRAEYIPSETRFGDMTGEAATDAEGAALAALFAPVLRPQDRPSAPARLVPDRSLRRAPVLAAHDVADGQEGHGEESGDPRPARGPAARRVRLFRGRKKTTEAGLRRSINMTAKPVRIDEMEAKCKSGRG